MHTSLSEINPNWCQIIYIYINIIYGWEYMTVILGIIFGNKSKITDFSYILNILNIMSRNSQCSPISPQMVMGNSISVDL